MNLGHRRPQQHLIRKRLDMKRYNIKCCVCGGCMGLCVQWYLHKLVEVQLSDTGVVTEEVLFGFKEVFVRQALLGGLQGTENKRSHHQVQHDPHQQGQEGGALHVLPVDPPAPPHLDLGGLSVTTHWGTTGRKQEVPLEKEQWANCVYYTSRGGHGWGCVFLL